MNLKRSFRLRRNAWRWRIAQFRLWFEQRYCSHLFRPVRIGDRPGRVCMMCGRVDELTPEEFFANFGERSWQR